MYLIKILKQNIEKDLSFCYIPFIPEFKLKSFKPALIHFYLDEKVKIFLSRILGVTSYFARAKLYFLVKEQSYSNAIKGCSNRSSIYFLTCKKCRILCVGKTADEFCFKWKSYKNNSRNFIMSCPRKDSCMIIISCPRKDSYMKTTQVPVTEDYQNMFQQHLLTKPNF